MCDMGMTAAGIGSMGGMGAMPWLSLSGLVGLGLVLAALVWLLRHQATPSPSLPQPPTPLEELDRRYARGELDREEYLKRRVDLVDRWSR